MKRSLAHLQGGSISPDADAMVAGGRPRSYRDGRNPRDPPPNFFDEKTGIIHWIKLDQWGMPLASKQTLYHDGFMQHPSAWPRMWPAAVFCGLLFLDPVFGGVPADPLVFP